MFPGGSLLQMPLSKLYSTHFSSFLIPGLILFLLLGAYPAFIVVALTKDKGSTWFIRSSIYKDQHWTWTGSIYEGIMLILWMDIEVMMIGYGRFLQTCYAQLGVAIVVPALSPPVNDYNRIYRSG